MSNGLTVHYIDEDGDRATHRYPVLETITDPTDAAVNTLLAAITTISRAGIDGVSLVYDKVPTYPVGTGPYDAEDKLVSAFATVGGIALRIAIPAPIRALLAANDENWDKAEALVDSFASAVSAVVVTKGGALVGELKKSWRSRRNRKQK